jgi:hypothetical protein
MSTVDEVVSVLDRFRQRATYKAVGAVVGRPAQSVMSGRPHSRLDSWVVQKQTHMPTGYLPHEIHPELRHRTRVITSGADLASWLHSPS